MMMGALLALAIVTQTPGEVHLAAFADLQTVPIELRRETRYLSLAGYQEDEREALFKALVFALNSTSYRVQFSTPVRPLPYLVRMNLTAYGWDRKSRQSRIDLLKKQGVDTSSFKVDLWEEFARADPFFFTTTIRKDGTAVRGWLDPEADYALRLETNATKSLLRADWLLARILLEKGQGGFYSQALMFSNKEGDLYKAFGVDEDLVDNDSVLRTGGAVLKSIVATHNRELQMIPSSYGYDDRYIWRTFDFSADVDGNKSVVDALAGTVKHDGREIIGTLPNGLHWYYLSDGKGNQAEVVPQNIAFDNRQSTPVPIRDRNVLNAYKCIACHGPVSGIYPFDDVIRKTILAQDVDLASFVKDAYGKAKFVDEVGKIEDYYRKGLSETVGKQQGNYAERVAACNGLESGTNSVAMVDFIETYIYDLVTPEVAAAEMGRSLEVAKTLWRNSGNNQLVVLSSGQPIKRGPWERAWIDAMKADVYPWDSRKKGQGY